MEIALQGVRFGPVQVNIIILHRFVHIICYRIVCEHAKKNTYMHKQKPWNFDIFIIQASLTKHAHTICIFTIFVHFYKNDLKMLNCWFWFFHCIS